jgi:hypothetical protein
MCLAPRTLLPPSSSSPPAAACRLPVGSVAAGGLLLLAALPNLPLEGVDWVIGGGESGPGARPLREPLRIRELLEPRDAADRLAI